MNVERPSIVTSFQNDRNLRNVIRDVITESNRLRPRSTTRTYENKQSTWRQWCETRQFEEGAIVTEGKLLLYLNEFAGALRSTGEGAERDVECDAGLSAEGVQNYVKVVVDLYKTQQSLGFNNHPHPRGKALKSYLYTLKVSANKRKRDNHDDHGYGTVLETYGEEDMQNLSHYYFDDGSAGALQDRLDFLLGHALMARGETTHQIQLPNLSLRELKESNVAAEKALIVIINRGKTNQVGRVEYGSAVRHREVNLCSVGALAMYLFYRFHVSGERFPDFTTNKMWYDTALIRSTEPMRAISAGGQQTRFKQAMNATGIVSSKSTHLRRHSARVIAGAGGATAQVRLLLNCSARFIQTWSCGWIGFKLETHRRT